MFELLWHHFQEGGWAMWLILFWLVCAIVVIIERSLYLFSSHQDPDVLMATLLKSIDSRDMDTSVDLALHAKTPLGRILAAALNKPPWRPEDVQNAMDIEALVELPKLSKRIPLLALYANLAMLCGLFGTIVGLIKAFGSVAGDSVDPASKARLLAEGISEAMNCTAFGLMSAIVALAGYAVLNGWVQAIEDDIQARTVQLYNALAKFHQR